MKKLLHLPFRQVHLDSHQRGFLPDIGSRFDPDEFVETLTRAHVNLITGFARCCHGWSYFPTKIGYPHPNLTRDLLGDMVRACRKASIQTPAYLAAGAGAENWLVDHPDDAAIAFTENGPVRERHVCFSNGRYVKHTLDLAMEVCDRYDVPGLFFDGPGPSGDLCVCEKCVERMKAAGRDPKNPVDIRANSRELTEMFMKTMREGIAKKHPNVRMFFNSSHIHKGMRNYYERYYTHLEVESLPTVGWGYYHFPFTALYLAVGDMLYVGMSGKFHTRWGDHGGLKTETAFIYESMQMLALGARCMFGDALHNDGRLDPATYKMLTPAYERVEKLESTVRDSKPVADIAMLAVESIWTPRGQRLDKGLHSKADYGCSRMLLELHETYHILDADDDFSTYKLIILPDEVTIEEELAGKLNEYLAAGGKLVLSGSSGMDLEEKRFLVDFDAEYAGKVSELSLGYVLGDASFEESLPEGPITFYSSPYLVKGREGCSPLATRIPQTAKSAEAHKNQNYAPCDYDTQPDYDALIISGNIAYFAHPVFRTSYETGLSHYKKMLKGVLDTMLGRRRVELTNLPSAGRAILSRQPGNGAFLLHLLYAPEQFRGREPENLKRYYKTVEVIDDAPVICDVECKVKTGGRARSVRGFDSGELSFTEEDGYTCFTINRMHIHEMVTIEVTAAQ